MFNPSTCDIEPYVETWRRFSISPGAPYCVLELVSEEAAGDKGYIGRVGDYSLGCVKRRSGEYIAWREDRGKTVYDFGRDNFSLPSLPKTLPEDWRNGERCTLGGRTFVIRAIGVV